METKKLIVFNEPDEIFYAIKQGSRSDEYHLASGTDHHSELKFMDDNDLKTWALERCENDEEEFRETYVKDDGSIDYESIKSDFEEEESDYPPNWTYPEGRAYEWFDNLYLDFPDHIEIAFGEGFAPGHDGCAVVVCGYESLVDLQAFLKQQSIKMNFIVKDADQFERK